MPDPVQHSRVHNNTPLLLIAIALVAGIGLTLFRSALSADPGPLRASAQATFEPAIVARGAWLSAIGNCSTCHTVERGASFAGGRPLSTPFGTIYSTNISPDVDTGIGRWSIADFSQAMRQGVARDGHNLYPAFPYDHFTHVTDDDINAIYAFLMTRDAVHAQAPANHILVPRAAIAIWKTLYLKPGPIAPDPAHDLVWNRGRYLVDGLGHCGGCHTPRNALGAEKAQEDLAGSSAEGWRAPALNASTPAPVRWSVAQIATYLHTGFDATHGTAAGSMASVSHNMSSVPAEEVNAIAVYLVSRMEGGAGARASSDAAPTPLAADEPFDPRQRNDGDAIYRGTCAGCHDNSRRGIALDHSTSTTDASPANFIRVTLEGIHPREGEKGGVMPAFSGALDDAQLASLLAFVRTHFGRAPPWTDLAGEIAKAKDAAKREGEQALADGKS